MSESTAQVNAVDRAPLPQSTAAAPAQLCVAYLVNQYPKVSHTFIRREIEALEARGARVERFSLRRCADVLVDETDLSELKRTRIVLQEGALRLGAGLLRACLTRPLRFAQALWLALRIGWNSDRGLFPHLAYLAEACILLGWFRQKGVQHLHAHFATNPAAVAMLCHVLGGPSYSFTAHGPDDFDRARSLALDEKIARARFVLSVSSYGRSQLLRWCHHTYWSKIHVLHPGMDDSFLLHPPTPIPSEPRLVCVGRLDEQKGQLLLLDAVRQLISAGGRCELVLVGGGPLRAEIESRISQLRLQDHVVLAGSVTSAELRRQIQNARAVVLPSLAENLPSVIMEAFALHRPVIATFIGGIPELVEPGVCGWLVPAGSVDALQAAMREVLDAPVDILEQMGREGARRVHDQYRSADAAGRLLRMFQTIGES